MLRIIIAALIFFAIAVLMTMIGRGGGNFYVFTLVLIGMPMHEAATTGQFLLFTTACAAMLVFKKKKILSLPLALVLGVLAAGMAFIGGFAAYSFSGRELKIIFSVLLALAGAAMLFTAEGTKKEPKKKRGYWNLRTVNEIYVINLWLAVPFSMAAGFFSGMVGVSGGSFLVPLMVLAYGVPMHIAVGTASAMVAATALAGFTGHAVHGSFNPAWAVPVACVTILGGILGSKIAIKTKPKYLKTLFALTTLLAALFMIVNASVSG
jgi:uncharacterized membrane protein YfcA